MESEGVLLPIHKHLMMPWNDMGKGDCCGRYETITNGYYCNICNFFVHKKCGDEASESIQHPSHSIHPLKVQSKQNIKCDICDRHLLDLSYGCEICKFNIDLHCVKNPPPEVIDIPEKHRHELSLCKDFCMSFDDNLCAERDGEYRFPYKCYECDTICRVDGNSIWNPLEVERPSEVNHSYHSLHPLKLLTGVPPEYSDGLCRLCGRKVDKIFYHCSSCNFTLDMRCVLSPPPQSLYDLKADDHQLTLLPRLIAFTCNACGLKGDRSPYICYLCDFVIHKDCLGLPRIININRHDHRVSRISLIGVVNSICGVCREKMDWTCGGYSCQKCVGYTVHSKCATRKDVWNGKELEEVPEEVEDIEPYVVIDENAIQHFSHKEHHLRIHINGVLDEENKQCRACNYPVCLQSFLQLYQLRFYSPPKLR